ncbi:MAG: glutamate--cysteine ligase [Gammaproteobacteria bacterium]|nr:glutamate--cysteine ligase [Gammaproteobacteria bacterium]
MTDQLQQRLIRLMADSGGEPFGQGRFGIEKECLRVTPDGMISGAPHPSALGSALKHAFITTDFSEALVEFVTPPVGSSWAVMQFLCDLHQYTNQFLGDEILWPMSMPCRLHSDDDVPIAKYGTSNIGQMKTVYRRGLAHRYGRKMQAIAGIHFNYSLPDSFWEIFQSQSAPVDAVAFRSDAYMGLVRNVRRYGWLLSYLFGASPALDKSFLGDETSGLELLDSDTLYGRYATSLRMSQIGYQNSNQAALDVSANSIEEYIDGLNRAVSTPHPDYERIGVRDGDRYLQLNTNILQVENEFYSSVRPKRVAQSGERVTHALRHGGVEYVELRVLDLSPFDPVGINQQQIHFLEAFLVYCLLADSPPIAADERLANSRNQALVGAEGRKPGLMLEKEGAAVPLKIWAQEICLGVQSIAEMMDPKGDAGHRAAAEVCLARIADPQLTPSSRLLGELLESRQTFFEYTMSLGRDYADYFRSMGSAVNGHRAQFETESRLSQERQAAVEAADSLSFEEFLTDYYR